MLHASARLLMMMIIIILMMMTMRVMMKMMMAVISVFIDIDCRLGTAVDVSGQEYQRGGESDHHP